MTSPRLYVDDEGHLKDLATKYVLDLCFVYKFIVSRSTDHK